MDWIEARRRFLRMRAGQEAAEAAAPGAGGAAVPRFAGDERSAAPRARRAVSLCVASGKGGTGKSIVSAALARLLSTQGRTLLLDADLGVGNAHILQDVSPERTLVDVVEGRVGVRDVRTPCVEGLDLVAAGSGVPRMAELSSYEMHLVAHGLRELEGEYDFVIVDSAAGISRQTISFAEASDVSLVVTTPDLTAMTDAYAFLKVLYTKRADAQVLLVVNRAEDEGEALRIERRIADVSRRFLGVAPRFAGWIPADAAVTRSVNRRTSVVTSEPESAASEALAVLAERVVEELAVHDPRGLGRLLLSQIGYSGDAV